MTKENTAGPRWFRVVAAALLLILFGCSQDEKPASGPVCLDISADSSSLAEYQVALDLREAGVLLLDCPGASSASVAVCEGTKVSIANAAAGSTATVKARFFRTQTLSLDPGSGNCSRVMLEALPEFVYQADDYATGFEQDGAAYERFKTMAVSSGQGEEESLSMKFYIEDLANNPTVYFQNTRNHPLHYEFVRGVLKRTISREDYEMSTYHGADRTGMAGILIAHPALKTSPESLGVQAEAPITMEFFPSDDLTPAQALQAYRLVEERLGFSPLRGTTRRLFYLPAGDGFERQLKDAERDFQVQGALWITRVELYGQITQQLLNSGVAFGTLRAITPEALIGSVVSYKDILLLSLLPLDLPLVGGTITEELQTPLSHVNVAARARHTPNMAMIGASQDERIAPFLNKLVRFEVSAKDFSLREATEEEAEAFWEELKPDQPIRPESDLSVKDLPAFSELGFNDALAVGVKAANLAEMHKVIPENSPDGFAVPFYFYDEFMHNAKAQLADCATAQTDCEAENRAKALCQRVRNYCEQSLSRSMTLEEYRASMMVDADFVSDTLFREASLDSFRFLIRHASVDDAFAVVLNGKVKQVFGAETKVRMRSSTNSEDLPNFTGAGLYSSYTADGTDTSLPSQVIRKVWASVWNWQAFEEREYWGIQHDAVYMGVAVHPSFGDEAANGVVITANLADPSLEGYYVNVQVGEVSVTNPEGGKMPEVLSLVLGAGGVQVVRQRFSDLSPDKPIMSEDEAKTLYLLVSKVQAHFAPLYKKAVYELVLDIEFKLDQADRRVVLKQVRPFAGASQ